MARVAKKTRKKTTTRSARRTPVSSPSPSTRARTTARRRPRKKTPRPTAAPAGLTIVEVDEIESLRRELQRTAAASPLRWNADPEDVQRSVAQLVLTLVEFIRKLLERQAIRRMEAGTLTDTQTEDVGRALMTLEETVRDIAAKFGLSPEELNLDLGPIGRLM